MKHTAVTALVAAACITAAGTLGTLAQATPAAPTPAASVTQNTQLGYVVEATPELTDAILSPTNELPLFLVFGNPMCGGCKKMRQVQEELAPQQRDFISVYVDTRSNPRLVEKFGVRLAPEMIVLYKGNLYVRDYAWPGEKTARKWIAAVLDSIKNGTEPPAGKPPFPFPPAQP